MAGVSSWLYRNPYVASQTRRPICLSRQLKKPTFDGPKPPTRPASCFFLFQKDQRELMNVTNENMGQFHKKCSEQWKNMSWQMKSFYRMKYIEQKKDYDVRMGEFMQGVGGEQQQEEYLRSLKEYKKKRSEYIKYWRIKLATNPTTVVCRTLGYNLYVADVSECLAEEDRQQYLKDSHWEEWYELSDKETRRYLRMASELSRSKLENVYSESVPPATWKTHKEQAMSLE